MLQGEDTELLYFHQFWTLVTLIWQFTRTPKSAGPSTHNNVGFRRQSRTAGTEDGNALNFLKLNYLA